MMSTEINHDVSVFLAPLEQSSPWDMPEFSYATIIGVSNSKYDTLIGSVLLHGYGGTYTIINTGVDLKGSDILQYINEIRILNPGDIITITI